MELKKISLNLKHSIIHNNQNILDYSPYSVAEFLDIYSKILQSYICYANEQLGEDSEAYISKNELEKIDSLFRELTDNFFPMAHTNNPLRDLQIVETEKFRVFQNRLMHFIDHNQRTNEISEYLSESIERLTNP